ncbi:hypothetical protein B0H15DRAFT_84704 [Mycena belliarum]|uniref:Uncharacterized protein n=1 Tax=Mycena belliarum TaxID=1033014 RepID=A0AAD6TME6_9AGAR|nr:hypothetical protein B0H15DRAFT_84704 [Mycena belliae]
MQGPPIPLAISARLANTRTAPRAKKSPISAMVPGGVEPPPLPMELNTIAYSVGASSMLHEDLCSCMQGSSRRLPIPLAISALSPGTPQSIFRPRIPVLPHAPKTSPISAMFPGGVEPPLFPMDHAVFHLTARERAPCSTRTFHVPEYTADILDPHYCAHPLGLRRISIVLPCHAPKRMYSVLLGASTLRDGDFFHRMLRTQKNHGSSRRPSGGVEPPPLPWLAQAKLRGSQHPVLQGLLLCRGLDEYTLNRISTGTVRASSLGIPCPRSFFFIVVLLRFQESRPFSLCPRRAASEEYSRGNARQTRCRTRRQDRARRVPSRGGDQRRPPAPSSYPPFWVCGGHAVPSRNGFVCFA